MASITTEANGRRTIQFVAKDGKRKSIRLGKCSQQVAEAVKVRVEHLNAATIHGHAVDADMARWLLSIDGILTDKLAAVGLITEREAATLGPFLTAYLDSRTDVKDGTRTNYEQVQRDLLTFFGEAKPLAEISAGDADAFRLHLLGKLGDNTVRRRCGRAKQFFRAAARKRLIAENPFGDMKACSVRANRERDYFVSPAEARKVLDACPDAQWRLLFALSRYGGLRCPSEHLALRWGDVDWANDRLTVRSAKTEHHEGKETRVVPIFPELRPYLAAVFDDAQPGTEHFITRYREQTCNLRTQLMRIIRRAGLKPWPKLFHNLRATRETELAADYPLHVVCEWIGNSRPVALKHYLRVTDADFEKAATATPKVAERGGAESGAVDAAEAVQNPGQHLAHCVGKSLQDGNQAPTESALVQPVATHCKLLQHSLVTPTGLEPVLPP